MKRERIKDTREETLVTKTELIKIGSELGMRTFKSGGWRRDTALGICCEISFYVGFKL